MLRVGTGPQVAFLKSSPALPDWSLPVPGLRTPMRLTSFSKPRPNGTNAVAVYDNFFRALATPARLTRRPAGMSWRTLADRPNRYLNTAPFSKCLYRGSSLRACPHQPERPRSGPEWLIEIKHDGFRVIARKDGKRERLSRHLHRCPLATARSRNAALLKRRCMARIDPIPTA
jgi:hypothetical protein